MPTITIQVGQAGNQLGSSLWDILAAQQQQQQQQLATSTSGRPTDASWHCEDSAFFKHDPQARRRARCVLVDTEPKVVNTILSQDHGGLFMRQRCFFGQSGRGNNWAYGYHQMSADSQKRPAGGYDRWNSSAATEDASATEFRILEHVFDGIRRESEECDGAPDFLLLHSLGGGSGSGMGSRILERVRQEYPRNYIATASVAPRPAGDSPMQSLNSVMALSFLQAYADAVMLFNNQDWIDKAGTSGGAVDLADINRHMAACIAGVLWPLDADEARGGQSRIRDMVTHAAPDTCMKLLSARTASCHSATPAQSLWGEAVRAVSMQTPKFDALDGNRPVTSTGALLLARGFPSDLAVGPAVASYVRGGGFASPADAATSTCVRIGSAMLLRTDSEPAGAAHSTTAGRAAAKTKALGSPAPSLSIVANRSSAVGMLSTTVDRALTICQAGAYLHWYEKYGCSKDAVVCAAHQMMDVADCYRMAHGIEEG